MTTPNLPAIPAIPFASLVAECMARVAACQTGADIDTLSAEWQGGLWRSLHRDHQSQIRAAATAKRATFAALASDAISDALVADRASESPTTPSATSTDRPNGGTLDQPLPEGTARRTATPVARRRNDQTPEAIRTAIQVARAAGARLAGYSGQVVDPGGAIGTIVAFGAAHMERDPVSDRMRQVLVRWSNVEAALTGAGLPADLLGKPQGDIAQLGQATKILNHSGYIARNVRNLGRAKSAWIIGRVDLRIDSDTLGDRECMISLMSDGTLVLTDPTHAVALQVVAEYQNRMGATLIESSALRTKIEHALEMHYGARVTDLGLYVSPWHAGKALDLIVAIRPIAGRKIYAWSHTDKASISEALGDSFALDLAKLESDVASKSDDLKRIAGATLIERIERLKSECAGLTLVIGASLTEGYKARLDVADRAVNAALDSTSARFANLELS